MQRAFGAVLFLAGSALATTLTAQMAMEQGNPDDAITATQTIHGTTPRQAVWDPTRGPNKLTSDLHRVAKPTPRGRPVSKIERELRKQVEEKAEQDAKRHAEFEKKRQEEEDEKKAKWRLNVPDMKKNGWMAKKKEQERLEWEKINPTAAKKKKKPRAALNNFELHKKVTPNWGRVLSHTADKHSREHGLHLKAQLSEEELPRVNKVVRKDAGYAPGGKGQLKEMYAMRRCLKNCLGLDDRTYYERSATETEVSVEKMRECRAHCGHDELVQVVTKMNHAAENATSVQEVDEIVAAHQDELTLASYKAYHDKHVGAKPTGATMA